MSQYAVSVWVNGEPKGQPRPRAVSFRDKLGQYRSRMYDPGTAENWKAQVQLALADQVPEEPILGPVSVVMTFVFPRPKRLLRKKDPDGRLYHTKKPDVDNAVKAVLDAITNLRIWHDDTQVSELSVRKEVAAKHGRDSRPGLALTIVQKMSQEDAEAEAIEIAEATV